MNNHVKEKPQIWLSQFPESTHPLDSRRLYDVVIARRETDTTIGDDHIRDMLNELKPNWSPDYVEEFIHKKLLLMSELLSFYDYFRSSQ